MRIVRDFSFVSPADRGASAAIGNFDGVHLGHRSVISLAAAAGSPLAVVTFEPHPRQYFRPEAPPFRLMNAEARANRLARLGVDLLFELPFDARLAALSAEDFAEQVLARGLGLGHVTVGRDFQFGRARGGDAASLARLGIGLGFGVTLAPLVAEGGAQVSSTGIRQALTDGRPREAARMLGHWHRIEGEVIRGDQRGRDLGYPTANMSIAGLHPPCFGVYAVLARVLTGPHRGDHHGVASLGVRPMFGENRPNLETFLFDFAGSLYGEHLSVALVDWLRPEMTFDGLPALIARMDADSAQARGILAAL